MCRAAITSRCPIGKEATGWPACLTSSAIAGTSADTARLTRKPRDPSPSAEQQQILDRGSCGYADGGLTSQTVRCLQAQLMQHLLAVDGISLHRKLATSCWLTARSWHCIRLWRRSQNLMAQTATTAVSQLDSSTPARAHMSEGFVRTGQINVRLIE